MLAATALFLVCHVASAESLAPAHDPVAELAARAELKPLRRIAVISFADQGPLTPWARDAVVTTLTRAGHDVATLAGTAVGADAARLRDYSRGFDGVAVVKISTGDGEPTLTVDVYGSGGERIVELSGPVAGPPPALPGASRLQLLPSEMTGPAFYEAMGRPDLAVSYAHRQTARGVLIGAGAVLAPVGLLLGILDAAATTAGNALQAAPCAIGAVTSTGYSTGQTCPQSQPSSVPWIIAAVGLVSIVTGAALPPDPLNESERQALYDARTGAATSRASVRLDAAPAARGQGGWLFLTARF